MNPMLNFDAQAALGFVLSQTTHIEAGVNETIYPDIQYPSLVPVDTSAHPFTQTVTYYSSDKFGAAKWINGNADDIPIAGTELAKQQTSVYTAGIGYAFGWEEVGMAMKIGYNLQANDANAARRAYEEFCDRVALYGDTDKGFSGLINHASITPIAAPNGAWDASATNEDEILGDINAALMLTYTTTKQAMMADTLLLPILKMNKLATTRLGDTTQTLLQFIRANNSYTAITGQPLKIAAVRGLETAGAGSTNRMIAYKRDPDTLKLHIPMPHRFLPVYQDGPLRWVVPGVFRMGGLDIRRKANVNYIDGI